MLAILLALAFEARHAAARADCLLDAADHLVLCSGPLPDWMMPATLIAGLLLTTAAAWRLSSAAD